MTPNQASIGEGRFDNSLIEPPDSSRVRAPQLPHGVSMKEKTFFGFGYFIIDVRSPAEFKVKEDPQILDCARVFDGGVVKGKGGERGFRGFIFSVKKYSSGFGGGEL